MLLVTVLVSEERPSTLLRSTSSTLAELIAGVDTTALIVCIVVEMVGTTAILVPLDCGPGCVGWT